MNFERTNPFSNLLSLPSYFNIFFSFMKSGKEYEIFVYEKFRIYFQSYNVTFDDKIPGNESKLQRQIDISIKGKIDNIDFLYIVQCKDFKKPATIVTIGEFSSVIKDVGASKGYLICASGFAKSIYIYAQRLGIELVTVEDINSSKWKANVEIPVIYIRKFGQCQFSSRIVANPELVSKNKNPIQIPEKDLDQISFDGGKTSIQIFDYLNQKIRLERIDVSKINGIEINDQNLLLKFSGIWVKASFTLHFIFSEIYYLKYIRPDEYSHIQHHPSKNIIPINLLIKNFSSNFDDTYIEIDKNDIPVFSNFNLKIEESLLPLRKESIFRYCCQKS